MNGDPSSAAGLTEKGRDESRLLGEQVRNVRLDVCVHSRFGRTLEAAELALAGRDVPFTDEPLLDDIDIGRLEGASLDDYRAWKRQHSRADPFPGGESLDAAAVRYGRALEALIARPEATILVVTHEIPVRYALNAARRSPDPDAPQHEIANATPYVFDDQSLAVAAAQLVGAPRGS